MFNSRYPFIVIASELEDKNSISIDVLVRSRSYSREFNFMLVDHIVEGLTHPLLSSEIELDFVEASWQHFTYPCLYKLILSQLLWPQCRMPANNPWFKEHLIICRVVCFPVVLHFWKANNFLNNNFKLPIKTKISECCVGKRPMTHSPCKQNNNQSVYIQ